MATPRHFKATLKLLADYDASPPVKKLGATGAAHYAALRRIVAHPYVVGLGIAEKRAGNMQTDELAIIFYVRRKCAPSKLASSLIIPPVIAAPSGEAIYTDVVEIGEVRPQSGSIVSGASIAHRDSASGTLGAIVNQAGQKMVLSNSHVLALEGFASMGDPVLLPATNAGGRMPGDQMATLAAFRRFTPGGKFVNKCDAALAAISAGALARIDASIPHAATPLRTIAPERGMKVVLTGHSSPHGPTSIIKDANALVQISYPRAGLVGFKDQVLCDQYTSGGDSGALVIDVDTGRVLGLHFAASALGSYFTPITTVMSELGFTL
jgi:hypothetical protein